jgi:RNA polymerase sigma-70 factor (ECF subfamily)
MGPLVRALVAELGAAPAALDELEGALAEFVAAGQAGWPELHLTPEALVTFLARVVPGPVLAGSLADLPAPDLFLACACAAGDAAAMRAFERRYFRDVDVAVARLGAPDAIADEVKQILRVRFFVRTGTRPPAIAEYAGRGDLHGWVRVSAVREVLRLLGRQRRVAPVEDALLDEVGAADPEAAALKRRYRGEFASAFRAAVAELPVRARMLLKLQVVDGLGVTAIGAIYHVHRATAARWLSDTRARLLADTEGRLAMQLHLSGDEVKSLIRFIRSQLDLSIGSLLPDAGAER